MGSIRCVVVSDTAVSDCFLYSHHAFVISKADATYYDWMLRACYLCQYMMFEVLVTRVNHRDHLESIYYIRTKLELFET